MRTHGRRIVILVVLLAAAVVPVKGDVSTQEDDPTIIVASDNPMGNVTPFYGETWVGGEMVTYVYDSLFLRSPELKLIPGLATSYSVSEDGLTYTVTLREGVTWHDGEPFDAEDVVKSYQWMAGMGGTRGASLRGLITETIEAASPYEVTFRLEETNPFFVDRALSIEIIPEHVWGAVFKDVDRESDVYQTAHDFEGKIGTGPFRFTEMERDQTYRFVRNDDYWGPMPEVEELVVTVIKDRTVMMQALSAGEVDVAVISIEPSAIDRFESDPAIDLLRGPDMANYSLFFNVERPFLAQRAVRQAIAQAIDIDRLVELITLGTGTKLTAGYPHPALWWAPDGLYHPYDPDQANETLDDAGFERAEDGIRVSPDGDRMSMGLICDANSPTEVRTAELIQGMLAEVGIEATPEAMDIESAVEKVWPEYSAANGRDYDMTIWLWSNYPMINRWATPMLFDPRLDSVGWANISGYINPEVEPLVDTFLSSPDVDEQRAAELELFSIVANDAPFVPLFSPGGVFAYRNEKYDGYEYKLGVGIHNRWTFLPESAWQEAPVIFGGETVEQADEERVDSRADAALETDSGGLNRVLPLIGLIVVLVVAAGGFLLYSRSRA